MAALANDVEIDIPTDIFYAVIAGGFALLFLAAMVLLGVQLFRTWVPRHRGRAVDAFSKSSNLTVPDAAREPLARYLAIRARGSLIGGLIALPLLLVALQPWADPAPLIGAEGGIVAFAVITIAGISGSLIGTLFARRTPAGAARAARMTDLTVADLLAPVERKLMTLCVIGGVVLPGILLLSLSAPWVEPGFLVSSGAPFLLIAGLVSGGLSLLLPRITTRIVASRAIPGDEHALAVSDALAALTLRQFAYLIIAVSGMAALMSFIWVAFAFPDSWMIVALIWGNLAFYAAVAALIVAFVVIATRMPERHVQRTLWPEFANDAQ
ncbi:MAG: hypothetical protein ACOH19_16850 [Rhodoglobus sp.]